MKYNVEEHGIHCYLPTRPSASPFACARNRPTAHLPTKPSKIHACIHRSIKHTVSHNSKYKATVHSLDDLSDKSTCSNDPPCPVKYLIKSKQCYPTPSVSALFTSSCLVRFIRIFMCCSVMSLAFILQPASSLCPLHFANSTIILIPRPTGLRFRNPNT